MKWDKDYIKEASRKTEIIPGFNVFGYEDAVQVVKAAEKSGRPVLLMVNKSARESMDIEHWGALLCSIAKASKIPVAVHLDHCTDINLIKRAIESGFTSVMYDGSKLDIEENIKNTNIVANMAHEQGCFVEAEIGNVPYSDLGDTNIVLTDVDDAIKMQERAHCDWLAISVGNVHRLTKQSVKIRFDHLKKIEENCDFPLVIHGSSGIIQSDLEGLVEKRIGKVNFGTALRKTFGNSLRKEIMENPDEFDRQKLSEKPFKLLGDNAYEIIESLYLKGEK